jgi:2-polyprenyl-6-methoxyphenol hydroxylase-like FAD-dependent oxidoreductase
MKNKFDVIIAGGGPVGLFLACELGLQGISVLVIERDSSFSTPLKSEPLGMRGINTNSIEAFYRRGMMDEVLDHKTRPKQFEKTDHPQFGGHFAGTMLDANKLDLSRFKYKLNGPSLCPDRTNIEKLCTVFAGHAEKLGVTIFKGTEVTAFEQSDEEVMVKSGSETYYGKWLVGCDGGRSLIRKSAGFEFVGTEAEFTGYAVLCELKDPEKLHAGFRPTKNGIYIMAAPGQVYVADFDNASFDRTQAVTVEHFQKVLRHVSGTDVTVEKIHFATTFTDRSLQATNYKKGRILLAGDSAHIHSPLGAQGLNTGIGDAINLGWKLALVVKGLKAEKFLDSYTEERHPVGAKVLEWTRAQVMKLKPNLFGEAVSNVLVDLINTDDGANYFMGRLWGISQRYDLEDHHPLVGSSVPDFEFSNDERLGPMMKNGRGLIIDFTVNSNLLGLASDFESRVDYTDMKVKDTLGLKALIVRPDGIVAWVAEESIDLEKAKAILLKWF